MTAEDLLVLPDTGHGHELIEGKLVKMPPGNADHGAVAMNLAFVVKSYVDSRQLGRVFAAETGFILRRNPDTVRAPDVSFITQSRLPEGRLPSVFLQLAPDLVAEVVSPGDTRREVQAKAEAWLQAGVQLVWVVYPSTQSVAAFLPGRDVRQLTVEDELTGDPVLPGFRCRVADLFR